MALTGTAEGLNVIYVAKTGEYLRQNVTLDMFSNLAISASIYWEEVQLRVIPFDQSKEHKEYQITGIWKGKSITDWRENLVRLKVDSGR